MNLLATSDVYDIVTTKNEIKLSICSCGQDSEWIPGSQYPPVFSCPPVIPSICDEFGVHFLWNNVKINSCSFTGYSCVLHRSLYLLAKFHDWFGMAHIWTQSLPSPKYILNCKFTQAAEWSPPGNDEALSCPALDISKGFFFLVVSVFILHCSCKFSFSSCPFPSFIDESSTCQSTMVFISHVKFLHPTHLHHISICCHALRWPISTMSSPFSFG